MAIHNRLIIHKQPHFGCTYGPRKSGHFGGRVTKQQRCKCRIVSIPLVVKPPTPSQGASIITSSNPNHLPKAVHLNTKVGFHFPFYDTAQWKLNKHMSFWRWQYGIIACSLQPQSSCTFHNTHLDLGATFRWSPQWSTTFFLNWISITSLSHYEIPSFLSRHWFVHPRLIMSSILFSSFLLLMQKEKVEKYLQKKIEVLFSHNSDQHVIKGYLHTYLGRLRAFVTLQWKSLEFISPKSTNLSHFCPVCQFSHIIQSISFIALIWLILIFIGEGLPVGSQPPG